MKPSISLLPILPLFAVEGDRTGGMADLGQPAAGRTK